MNNIKAIFTLIATLAFVLSPFFVSDFSGFSSDQLPIPQVNPPVQPAGYAFSIWGLIYIYLVISAIYGVAKRRNDAAWEAFRIPLIISVGIGAFWLPVALESAEWASVMIFIMLGGALLALLRTPVTNRWLLQAPIAVYAGWLSAASFVSFAIIIAGYGLVSAVVAAYISLTLAISLAVFIQLKRKSAPEYGFTIIWALVAIIIANIDKNIGIQIFAGLGCLLMLGLNLVFFYRKPTNSGNS